MRVELFCFVPLTGEAVNRREPLHILIDPDMHKQPCAYSVIPTPRFGSCACCIALHISRRASEIGRRVSGSQRRGMGPI